MIKKLPHELRHALESSPDKPLRVEDDQTNKVYIVVEEGLFPTLWDDYIRQEVERGLTAIDQGDVEDWDIEATIAEAKRRHAGRQQ